MKNIFLVILAVIAGFLGAQFAPSNKQATEHKETAYERVMRTKTLRCGYTLWPVFFEVEPNSGKFSGLAYDATEALGKVLGLKIEWAAEIPVGHATEALESGRIDATCVFDGPWNTATASLVNYARPLGYFQMFAYGRADESRFTTYDQMNDPALTVSTFDGDLSAIIAAERFPKAKNLGVPSSGDPSLLVLNVVDKKADFVLIDPMTIRTFENNNKTYMKKLVEMPLLTIACSFSIGIKEQELLNTINQGIDILWDSGRMDAIYDKYDPDRSRFLRRAQPWQP